MVTATEPAGYPSKSEELFTSDGEALRWSSATTTRAPGFVSTVWSTTGASRSGRSATTNPAIAEAVTAGARWTDVGGALGVSAQAAHRRFRWVRWDPDSGVVWHEPPLG